MLCTLEWVGLVPLTAACFLCTEVVREGSRRFEGVEPLGNSVQVPYTSCYHCVDEVQDSVQVPCSHCVDVKDFYTPFFLCTEVVREGSRRFEGVEPL